MRRRDNLTASIHMAVETIFWFYPLVWWIRTRLVEEREKACDEEVLSSGKPSMAYAEGILEVCKHYVESPLVCVSGISGANLRKRIESIMENPLMSNLSLSKKMLIVGAGVFTLITPITIGLLGTRPTRAETHSQSAASQSAMTAAVLAAPAPAPWQATIVRTPKPVLLAQAAQVTTHQNVAAPSQFATASLAVAQASQSHQPAFSQGSDSIMYQATKFSDIIQKAWPVAWYQVIWPEAWSSGGPPWSVGIQARYDLSATFPASTTPEQLQLMLQGLFADRLKLAAHWETQTLPVYALKVSAGGVKFQASADPSHPQALLSITPASYEFKPRFPKDPLPGPSGATLDQISQLVSAKLDRRVVNLTGLNGVYDIDLVVPLVPGTAPGTLNAGWSNAAYISALESQLGLTVVQETLPVRVLVIDNLQLVPTAAQ